MYSLALVQQVKGSGLRQAKNKLMANCIEFGASKPSYHDHHYVFNVQLSSNHYYSILAHLSLSLPLSPLYGSHLKFLAKP